MKLKSLKCPECGANIELEEGRDFCFCSYCGCKIILEDERQTITINKNININKNENRTNHYVDDAQIEQIKAEERKDKRDNVFIVVWWGAIVFILLGLALYFFVIIPNVAEAQGKISAGYYKDLVGDNYQSVEAHFEAAGFTNIELIDLKDSGLLVWKDGKVSSISIGGDTDFESHNYFYPDTKVVISYH